MPGMDGLELQRRMNDSGATIQVLFVSAHDDSLTRQRAFNEGAIDFLSKPFEAAKLLSTVRTAVNVVPKTSAAHVVYLGKDDVHRIRVLRKAGYAVHPCSSLTQPMIHSLKLATLADLFCI